MDKVPRKNWSDILILMPSFFFTLTQGVETEKLTCRINPIERRKFSSASGILDYRTNCTSDKFQQFESFFSELSKVARDFSLSPERQRFGVVSEQTLMKFLSIGDPDGWQLLIHFSGFSSSSKVLKDANDLKLALQMHQSSVSEVTYTSYFSPWYRMIFKCGNFFRFDLISVVITLVHQHSSYAFTLFSSILIV